MSEVVEQPAHPALTVLLRLFWMLLGNGILLIVAVKILQRPQWSLSLLDVWFWTLAIALFTARALDWALSGRAADGSPATPSQLKRYGARLAAITAGGWLLAQSAHL